jgi:hypothetical protein
VTHSELLVEWGHRNSTRTKVAEDEGTTQSLQKWSDWYTILHAQTLYHTHSDFSISALHWMNNPNTKVIEGYDKAKKELILEEESWRQTGETARLIDRTIGGPGTSELRLCQDPEALEAFVRSHDLVTFRRKVEFS